MSHSLADLSASACALGYAPRHDLAAGLAATQQAGPALGFT